MPKLYKLPADTWQREMEWLEPGKNCSPLEYMICLRAHRDTGILELPLGSNRGVEIDRYTRRASLPVPKDKSGQGWYWCAIWAGCVFADCGALIPRDFAATNSWVPFLDQKLSIGSAILYGVKGVAHHIGIVVRTDPMVLTIEGNRGFAGTTNNGVAVDIGPQLRKDVLGYFHPSSA